MDDSSDSHERDWRELDQQMRRLARRRAALDAEEARLLIVARAAQLHRHLGYGSFDEYLERVLGYAPTTARDRMRVAVALDRLPATQAALAAGTVTFSAVRELTRVATPETEGAWLGAIEGLTARQIEQCVRGHKPGDLPGDPVDPQLDPRRLQMELPPEVFALFLEARRALEGEVGHAMTDAEFMAVACRGVLRGDAPAAGNTPPHQVSTLVCVECRRGWQEAAGGLIEIGPTAIDRARCDAVEIGRVDGDEPEPAQRTIPAAVRRMVLARDHHCCAVPGCRSSRFIDVHHIRSRASGGDHDPLNLLVLCDLHHHLLHAGRIRIVGEPGALQVTHADGRPYGAPPPPPPAPDMAEAATHVGDNSLEVSASAAGRDGPRSSAPRQPGPLVGPGGRSCGSSSAVST